MDKPLSRQIGIALCEGLALFVFGVSQPSVTYEMAIGKQVPLSAARCDRARSVANPCEDLVV